MEHTSAIAAETKASSLIRLTLWRLLGFGDFRKKTPKRTWLSAGISPVRYARRPGKSLKRRSKSFSLHSNKNFLLGGCGFFVSDVISGGLLGHLGPLCLALGANH